MSPVSSVVALETGFFWLEGWCSRLEYQLDALVKPTTSVAKAVVIPRSGEGEHEGRPYVKRVL